MWVTGHVHPPSIPSQSTESEDLLAFCPGFPDSKEQSSTTWYSTVNQVIWELPSSSPQSNVLHQAVALALHLTTCKWGLSGSLQGPPYTQNPHGNCQPWVLFLGTQYWIQGFLYRSHIFHYKYMLPQATVPILICHDRTIKKYSLNHHHLVRIQKSPLWASDSASSCPSPKYLLGSGLIFRRHSKPPGGWQTSLYSPTTTSRECGTGPEARYNLQRPLPSDLLLSASPISDGFTALRIAP